MKKLAALLFLLPSLTGFSQSIGITTDPTYGCPNTTHDVSINVTNNIAPYPASYNYTISFVVKDNSSSTLQTFSQTYADGFGYGVTKTYTITSVPFAGPMTCTIDATLDLTYPSVAAYNSSTNYIVQYPPDLTLTESPAGTISVSTAFTGYTVEYYKDANYATADSITSATTYTPAVSGTYDAKASDTTTGCISQNLSNAISITVTPVMEAEKIHFSVYPNPLNSFLHVSGTTGKEISYQLIDSKGTVLRTGSFYSNTSLFIENLTHGIYFLNIKEDNQKIASYKLMK